MSIMRKTFQHGYTLIELLLYIAIAGSILVAVGGFFAMSADARIKAQSISEVNQQGQMVMGHITQAVRNASSITAPTAGSSAASLTLAMPDAGIDPTVFSLSGGIVYVQEAGGSAVPLTNSLVQVSDLTFTNASHSGTPGIINISFTMSRVNQTGKNAYDYEQGFRAAAAVRVP